MLMRRTAAVIAALSAAALGSAALGTPSSAADPAKTILGLSPARHTLAAFGTGSAAHAAAWQVCGSAAVAGAGVVVDHQVSAMLGDCANANAFLWQNTPPATISALADSALLAAPWQACASDTVAGTGAALSLDADKTMRGDCNNANVRINSRGGDSGYHTLGRGGLQRPFTASHDALVSAGSGSAIVLAPWQVCGSAAVAGAGAAVATSSHHVMIGDCNNGNAHIGQSAEQPSLLSVQDNSHVSVASWQVCGSTAVAGGGVAASLNSANIVYGDCNNANTVID